MKKHQFLFSIMLLIILFILLLMRFDVAETVALDSFKYEVEYVYFINCTMLLFYTIFLFITSLLWKEGFYTNKQLLVLAISVVAFSLISFALLLLNYSYPIQDFSSTWSLNNVSTIAINNTSSLGFKAGTGILFSHPLFKYELFSIIFQIIMIVSGLYYVIREADYENSFELDDVTKLKIGSTTTFSFIIAYFFISFLVSGLWRTDVLLYLQFNLLLFFLFLYVTGGTFALMLYCWLLSLDKLNRRQPSRPRPEPRPEPRTIQPEPSPEHTTIKPTIQPQDIRGSTNIVREAQVRRNIIQMPQRKQVTIAICSYCGCDVPYVHNPIIRDVIACPSCRYKGHIKYIDGKALLEW